MCRDTPEDYAHTLDVCPGCGGQKQPGCIVCWHCFKHRHDVTPFKYFDGGLNDWLGHMGIPPVVPPEAICAM